MKAIPKLFTFVAIVLISACQKANIKNDDNVPLPFDTNIILEEKLMSGVTVPSGPGSTIVHRNVNMVLSYNKHTLLDVDADGQPDFNFSSVLIAHDGRPHLYLIVNPKTASGAHVMVQNGPELVIYGLWNVPLASGVLIGESPATNCVWTEILMKGFIIDSSKNGSSQQYNGLWLGKTNQYLAIQFKTAGQVHYGWVKLTHQAGTDAVTISDYAYNSVAGQSINAGQIN